MNTDTEIFEPSQAAKDAFIKANGLVKPTNGTIEEKRAYLVKMCEVATQMTKGSKAELEYIRLANKLFIMTPAQINEITRGAK